MRVKKNRKKFYSTAQALEKIGISRATLFRWLREKRIEDVGHRDRRNWRLFTDEDIKRIREFAHRVRVIPKQTKLNLNLKKNG